MSAHGEESLLDKLDAVAPAPLRSFDAFPKLPAHARARSEGRGLLTVLLGLAAFFLVLNDIHEFVWGWPDYEFGVDSARDGANFVNVNMDMVVGMPCRYLSVDLRDVVGDRLYLSKGFRRDGTTFDVGQATALKEHSAMLSARQATAQGRKSRGFFGWWKQAPGYAKTYKHDPDASACRIFGSLQIKKVTANLHVTSLGHGYQSRVHVPHEQMNLSHVITEFSFGPYFPDIVQPLDASLELAHDPFVAYTYFLRVVPTTYVAPRSAPLDTAQYSVTHYTRVLEHNQGTPGIFFRFDFDPVRLTLVQRTTGLVAFLTRALGVAGGLFVCASWALRISSKALAVAGISTTDLNELAPPPASARASGLRTKWGGESLRARPGSIGGGGAVRRQGNSWVVEGASPFGSPVSPYPGTPYGASQPGTPYAGTPYAQPLPASPFVQPASPSPYTPAGYGHSPYAPPPSAGGHVPPPPMSARSASGGSARGLGLQTGAGPQTPGFGPGTPVSNSQVFPPTPAGMRFPGSPLGGPGAKEKDD